MRTVSFKTVLDGVIRRLGIDPDAEPTGHDTARAVTEHINTRLETAWTVWPFKELEVTEERAFRPFWNALRTYAIGDEVYRKEKAAYYVAIAIPTIGVSPEVLVFPVTWELMPVPLYGVIAFVQNDSEPIGQVMNIWSADPRVPSTCSTRSIGFEQTEDGLNVGTAHGLSTVWVTYRLPASQFTVVPKVAGKTYATGDTAYFPEEGECKRVLGLTTEINPVPMWVVVPFPAMFAPYVKLGAYADALLEVDDDGLDAARVQIRLAKASKAAATAEELLSALAGRQAEQGDKVRYRRFGRGIRRMSYGAWPCAA